MNAIIIACMTCPVCAQSVALYIDMHILTNLVEQLDITFPCMLALLNTHFTLLCQLCIFQNL